MFMGGLTAVATIAAPVASVALESWSLTPAAIHSWVETARAGSELTYARDYHLSTKSVAAGTVRKLVKAGIVTAVCKGKPGQAKAYIIQRLPTKVARTPKAKQPKMSGDMARVLRVIRRCIRLGEQCPSNRALAKAAGVTNPSYQIQKLVNAKIITNDIVDQVRGTRVVTLLDTGEATAAPQREAA